MKSILSYLPLVLFASLGIAGCEKNSEPLTQPGHGQHHIFDLTEEQAQQTLYSIGKDSVSVGEFSDIIAKQPPYLRARYQDIDNRKDFLEQMIKFDLFAREARAEGYYEKHEIDGLYKKLVIDDFHKNEIHDQVSLDEVSEKELKDYYDEHRQEFERKAQVRISHVLFETSRPAKVALKKIKKSKDVKDEFLKVVDSDSMDRLSKKRKGDLFFHEMPEKNKPYTGVVPKSVIEAAFKIPSDWQVFPKVIKSKNGYHIVVRTAFREASVRDFSQVKQSLRYRIWRKKRQEAKDKLEEQLKKKTVVEINPSLMDTIKVKPSDLEQKETKKLR